MTSPYANLLLQLLQQLSSQGSIPPWIFPTVAPELLQAGTIPPWLLPVLGPELPSLPPSPGVPQPSSLLASLLQLVPQR